VQPFDIDTMKSYKTEANLIAALERLGFAGDRHFIVCNRAGRFTAIFPFSNIQGGYVGRYSCKGFLTIG